MPTSWTTCGEPSTATYVTGTDGSASYATCDEPSASFSTCGDASLGGSHATRSTYTEFSSYGSAYGGYLSTRSDAVASRRTLAYAPGPEVEESTDTGESSAWRLRSIGTEFSLSIASGTAWSSESTLFSSHVTPDRVAFGFDRSGTPAVGFEAEGSIWLRYFDTLLSAQTYKAIASGRDPIVVMDDIESSTSGDLLLFWVGSEGSLLYAQQRDRYASTYTTPFSLTSRQWLEVGGRTQNGRLALLISEWGASAATYGLTWIFTIPFPVRFGESLGLTGEVSQGTLTEIPQTRPEELWLTGSARSGYLRDVLQFYTNATIETVGLTGSLSRGTMRDVLQFYVDATKETVGIQGSFSTGTLKDIIVYYAHAEKETLGLTGSISSGTLAVP